MLTRAGKAKVKSSRERGEEGAKLKNVSMFNLVAGLIIRIFGENGLIYKALNVLNLETVA